MKKIILSLIVPTLLTIWLISIAIIDISCNQVIFKLYKSGWNDAINAIPKAIIINAPWKVHGIARDIKEGKLPKNEIALDSEGNPAFVCSRPGVSSPYVGGGDFIDINQIFPEKK